MTAPPFSQPITLVLRTAAAQDSDGNTGWTETRTTVLGIFNSGGSSETQTSTGDVVVAQPFVRVYDVDPGTVRATDAVDIDGVRYEVDGVPTNGTNPWTGWSPNVRINLRRITG